MPASGQRRGGLRGWLEGVGIGVGLLVTLWLLRAVGELPGSQVLALCGAAGLGYGGYRLIRAALRRRRMTRALERLLAPGERRLAAATLAEQARAPYAVAEAFLRRTCLARGGSVERDAGWGQGSSGGYEFVFPGPD